MKKIITILFLFFISVVNIFSQNVTNPDFEEWNDPPTTPTGWTLDTQGGSTSFSQSTGESGFGLRASVTNDVASSYDGEFSQIISGIVAGDAYDFVIKVKGTTAVNEALRFWGYWQDISGNNLTSNNIHPGTYYSTTTGWAEYKILDAIAPTNAVKVKWAIRLYGLQTTDFDNVTTPLPVELSSFTVTTKDKVVHIYWTTETEIRNYGFEIERKTRNEKSETWEKIGFVPGAGNSNSPKDYSFSDGKTLGYGKYSYRLKQLDTDGKYEYLKEVEVDLGLVKEYALSQNYPNPFNPSTVIKYSIPQSGNVKLSVYNILGSEVATLINEFQEAGVYTKEFSVNKNGLNLSNGVYIYKLETGNFTDTKKFILMK